MKTLVVYTSQTGFTKKYAEWLSVRIKADMISHSYDISDEKYINPIVRYIEGTL